MVCLAKGLASENFEEKSSLFSHHCGIGSCIGIPFWLYDILFCSNNRYSWQYNIYLFYSTKERSSRLYLCAQSKKCINFTFFLVLSLTTSYRGSHSIFIANVVVYSKSLKVLLLRLIVTLHNGVKSQIGLSTIGGAFTVVAELQ